MPNWTPAKEAAYNSLVKERNEHFDTYIAELDILFFGPRPWGSISRNVNSHMILQFASELLPILQRFLDQK